MELNRKIFYSIIATQVLILSFSFYFIRLDDAYIFYTYAKNLVEGNGYVFNLNERINATTSFIYTLLLAIIFLPIRTNPALFFPLIGSIIGALSLLISSIMLSKLFFNEYEEEKLILPVIILSMPVIKNAVGMETFLKIMLIVLFLYACNKNKPILISLIGGLLVLTRADAILLIIITLIFYYLKSKSLLDFKSALILFAIIISYLIFCYLYFGSLFPTSLNVKILQRSLNLINGSFLNGFIKTFPAGANTALIFYLFVLLTFILLLIKRRYFLETELFQILFVYYLLHTIVYAFILNPPPYPWYYNEYILIISLIISFGLNYLLHQVKSNFRKNAVTVSAILIFLSGLILPLKTIKSGFNEKYILYKNIALYLNSFSNEKTTIAADEIGILGFYFKGKIVDELGLVTPIALEGIKSGDFSFTIITTQPDFVIVDYPEFPIYKSYINGDWFKSHYSEFYTLRIFNSGIRVFRKSKS